jgi:hypothetical protein
MKAQLREHIRVGGESTRNVEVERVDWDRRVVHLPDGKWVPFENVAFGEKSAYGPGTGICGEVSGPSVCKRIGMHEGEHDFPLGLIGPVAAEVVADAPETTSVTLAPVDSVPVKVGLVFTPVRIVPRAPGYNGTIEDAPRCGKCGKTFLKGRALAGHKRHCK